ncbi:MAG: host-nuclease inhibitor Gam family protein [Terriglobia bacterium]
MIGTGLLCKTKPTDEDQAAAANPTGRAARRRSSAVSSPDPRSWDEVNQRLGYLGEVERQIRALRDEFEQKAAVLKQQWLEASRPVEKERDRVQDQIERFYWARRDELAAEGRKSVDLAFGRMGSRLSRSVVVEDVGLAQQWLEAHGLDRFLRTRTEVDRDAIRSTLLAAAGFGTSVSHALLACPAIRFQETEQFWYALNETPTSGEPPARRKALRANPQTESGAGASHLNGRRVRNLDRGAVLPAAASRGGLHDRAD